MVSPSILKLRFSHNKFHKPSYTFCTVMLLPLVICPSFDNKVVSIHDSNVVEFVFPDFGCKVRQANKDSPYIGLNK